MPTNTYVALDKITTTGSVPSITFTSIPSTYTDLVLVVNGSNTATDQGLVCQVGTGSIDTAANYSTTYILGSGTSAVSGRSSGDTYAIAGRMDGGNSTSIIHFMNYSNATTKKTILGRGNDGTYVIQHVALWQGTTAINTIKVYNLSSVNIAAGSTFSLYGIAKQAVATTAKATGGTITYDAYGNVIHTFTSSGTFTPLVPLTGVDYLVVAGGGGGGYGRDFSPAGSYGAGGGGAGGLRSTVGATGGGGSLESQLSLTASAYTVTVGAGGAGATSDSVSGATGSNSVLSGTGITTVTSSGGGGAGTVSNDTSLRNGLNGGSGGGGADSGGPDGTGGTGTSGQGYAGSNSQSTNENGGGGGGAGSAGTSGTSSNGGDGGAAVLVPISGSNYYAGGGGGGAQTGRGGYGGGTATTANKGGATDGIVASNLMNAANATANTGGGAGGGYAAYNGGNGGSGIVIIRYSGL